MPNISDEFFNQQLGEFGHKQAQVFIDKQGVVRVARGDKKPGYFEYQTKDLSKIAAAFTKAIVEVPPEGPQGLDKAVLGARYTRLAVNMNYEEMRSEHGNLSVFASNIEHLNRKIEVWNEKVKNNPFYRFINWISKITIDKIPIETLLARFQQEHGVQTTDKTEILRNGLNQNGPISLVHTRYYHANRGESRSCYATQRMDGGVTVAMRNKGNSGDLPQTHPAPIDLTQESLEEYFIRITHELNKKGVDREKIHLQHSFPMTAQKARELGARVPDSVQDNVNVVVVVSWIVGDSASVILDTDKRFGNQTIASTNYNETLSTPMKNIPRWRLHVCSPDAVMVSMDNGFLRHLAAGENLGQEVEKIYNNNPPQFPEALQGVMGNIGGIVAVTPVTIRG